MKAWIPIGLAVCAAVGCQQQQKPTARGTTPSVLDVSAPIPASASTYKPAPYTGPVYTEQPAYVAPAQPVVNAIPAAPVPAAPAASADSAYTVKKGDTLFRIAKQRYGDGKKWQQIAAANPGVTPTSLRIGQTLVMP